MADTHTHTHTHTHVAIVTVSSQDSVTACICTVWASQRAHVCGLLPAPQHTVKGYDLTLACEHKMDLVALCVCVCVCVYMQAVVGVSKQLQCSSQAIHSS